MKKLKKFFVSAIMSVVAFVMALASPILSIGKVVMADYDYQSGQNTSDTDAVAVKDGAVFGVEKSTGNNLDDEKKNYTVGDTVSVPKIDAATVRAISDGSEITSTNYETKVTVYTPKGTKLTSTQLVESGSNYEFTANQVGSYKVEYAVKLNNNVWTVTNKYSIKVTEAEFGYTFPANDPIVLPISVDTHTAVRTNIPEVTLPLPIVNNEGKQVKILSLGAYTNKAIVAVYNDTTFKYDITEYQTLDTFVSEYNLNKDAKDQITKDDIFGMIIEVNTDTKNYTNKQAQYDADSSYTQLAYNSTGVNKHFYHFRAEEGMNHIRYRLTSYDGAKTYYEDGKTIEGSNSYDSSKIDIGFTVQDAPTSASLNDKTYLPLAKAYDKNNSNATINVYTKVTVQHYTGKDANGNATYANVAVGQDDLGMYFIPTEAGDYEISYTVVDFYGNQGYNYNYTIKEVKDKVAPTMYLVNSYDIDNLNTLDKTDNKFVIPTKLSMSSADYDGTGEVTITLPAIYAEDSTTDFKDLTITRRITSSDFVSSNQSSIYIQSDTEYTSFADKSYTNYSITEGNKFYKTGTTTVVENLSAHKATQNATVTLKDTKFAPGTYTIYYSVSDKAGNAATWSTKLELVDTFEDDTAPTVKFEDTITTVVDNQDVTINPPTVVDDTDGTYVNKYFIYFPVNTEVNGTPVVSAIYHELKVDENGKLSFNTSDVIYNNGTKDFSIYDIAQENDCTFEIVAYSFDDYALYKNDLVANTANITEFCKTLVPTSVTAENVGVATSKVIIKDTTDPYAPIIYAKSGTDFNVEKYNNFNVTSKKSYEQYGTVYVDGVKIWDNRPGLTIVATIRDSEGNIVPGYKTVGKTTVEEAPASTTINGQTTPVAGYLYTLPGISFTAGKSDSYTVTYTATDRANNVSVYTALLPQTTDREKPTITGYKTEAYELELGQSLSLVDIVATDNLDTEITVESECLDHSNYITAVSDKVYTFDPQATGTYKIKFTAVDGSDNKADPVEITVNVKHTIKPVVKLLSQEIQKKWYSDKHQFEDEKVYLPGFSVVDEEECQFDFDLPQLENVGEIKVTGPSTYTVDGTTKKDQLFFDENASKNAQYYFYPTTKGTYTVTYSAYDAFGNTAEPVVLEITVGETIKPTITLTDAMTELFGKEILVGGTLTFDLKDVTVTDNIKTEKVLDDDVNSPTYGQMIDKEIEYSISSVTLTNASGTAVEYVENEDGTRTYTFEAEGDYTLTMHTQDKAGNNQSYTTTIKVVAEPTNTSNATEIVGIVLILVSLAVLAGVIIYFAKPQKKSTQKVAAKKKAAKKDEPKV